MSTVYADSLGFIAPPGKDPVFGSKRPGVSLMHITSVPPLPKFTEITEALGAHNAFRDRVLSNPDTHAVLTQDDVEKPGSIGFVFGMQHMPKVMTEHHLQWFYDAGMRVMALAYNGPTEYGDGFTSPLGGLTNRGRDMIRAMSNVGMVLDLSHASHRTAEDAIGFIGSQDLRIGVMASHSAVQAEFPHARNLNDYTLREIAHRGGYIGIPAITFMLTKQLPDGGSYLPILRQHIIRAIVMCIVAGNKYAVGIGSDCIHGNMTLFEANNHFEQMSRVLSGGGAFRAYFPDRPTEVITHGEEMFSIFDTALNNLDPSMREGVLGKNFMAFLKRSLPQA